MDRWAGDLEAEIPEYACFPFGGGPRHCIGTRFAMAELKLAPVTLVDRFAFESIEGELPELSVAITLKSTEPVEMRITEG